MGEQACPVEPTRGGHRLLLSDGVPEPVEKRLRAAGFETGRACGGAVAIAPLLPGVCGGLRVAKYATISARGRIGLLVAREAGARVETGDGGPFPDSLDEPATTLVVAADDETARAVRAALLGA
jgi:hypothetical protein